MNFLLVNKNIVLIPNNFGSMKVLVVSALINYYNNYLFETDKNLEKSLFCANDYFVRPRLYVTTNDAS